MPISSNFILFNLMEEHPYENIILNCLCRSTTCDSFVRQQTVLKVSQHAFRSVFFIIESFFFFWNVRSSIHVFTNLWLFCVEKCIEVNKWNSRLKFYWYYLRQIPIINDRNAQKCVLDEQNGNNIVVVSPVS